MFSNVRLALKRNGTEISGTNLRTLLRGRRERRSVLTSISGATSHALAGILPICYVKIVVLSSRSINHVFLSPDHNTNLPSGINYHYQTGMNTINVIQKEGKRKRGGREHRAETESIEQRHRA